MIVAESLEIVEGSRAERHRDALHHVQILDGHGHAQQRRGVALHLRDGLLRRSRLLAGDLGGHRDVGADLVVQTVDTIEVVLGDVDGGEFACADRGGLLACAEVMNMRHVTEQ